MFSMGPLKPLIFSLLFLGRKTTQRISIVTNRRWSNLLQRGLLNPLPKSTLHRVGWGWKPCPQKKLPNQVLSRIYIYIYICVCVWNILPTFTYTFWSNCRYIIYIYIHSIHGAYGFGEPKTLRFALCFLFHGWWCSTASSLGFPNPQKCRKRYGKLPFISEAFFMVKTDMFSNTLWIFQREAPEKMPKPQKERRKSKNHPFSGANC